MTDKESITEKQDKMEKLTVGRLKQLLNNKELHDSDEVFADYSGGWSGVFAAKNLRFYGLWLYEFVQSTPTARYADHACPDGIRQREGNGSEPCPRDLRLQFFETQEQCKLLKQEINTMYALT